MPHERLGTVTNYRNISGAYSEYEHRGIYDRKEKGGSDCTQRVCNNNK